MSQKKKAEKNGRKHRTERKFPAITFEEALALARAIQDHAAGQRVRRLTLFEKLDQSLDSSETRRLITASNQYGLTKGSYQAEYLELTPLGTEASDDDVAPAKQIAARFELSIRKFEPFKALYDRLKNNKLPAREVMLDYVQDVEMPEDQHGECVDTFVLNAKFLRLLRTISGSQRLVPIEQVIEEGAPASSPEASGETRQENTFPAAVLESVENEIEDDFSKVCFYVTPIGESGSEYRRHSDFMIEYIIQPAVKEFGLKVIRADQMSKPGMIGKQVIEHILRSRLVVADLSFHNPMFSMSFACGIRHACLQCK